MADVRNHPNWLQHAADVMVLLATDGAVLDVTESAESLFGYPLAEIIGSSMLDWVHPDDVERIATTFLGVVDSPGKHVPMTCRVRHTDGRWLDVEGISVNAVQDVDGIVTSLRDVTAQRKFRLALERIAAGSPLDVNLALLAELVEGCLPDCAAAIAVPSPNGLQVIGGPRGKNLVGDLVTLATSDRFPCCADTMSPLDAQVELTQEPLAVRLAERGYTHWWTTSLAPGDEALGWLWILRDNDHQPGHGEREHIDQITQLAGLAVVRDRAHELLLHQASHDSLTGLLNRAALLDRLEAALALGRRTNHPLAVLFVDLDRFKEVNDEHGHPVGDLLLAAVGDRLSRAVDHHDLVSRYGGDEFVAVCTALEHTQDAVAMAEQVIATMGRPFTVGELVLSLGVSVGVALAASPATGAAELLRAADTAMYEAKRAGGSRWAVDPHAARLLLSEDAGR